MGKSRPEIGKWYQRRNKLRKLGVKLAKRKPPKNLSPLEQADYYRGRDTILLGMGYASYKEYLNSALWKSIRVRCMQLSSGSCVVCSKKAVNVHHNRYTLEALDGVNLSELYPLCRTCHEKVEFRDDGSKRCMNDAQQCLKSLLQNKWK